MNSLMAIATSPISKAVCIRKTRNLRSELGQFMEDCDYTATFYAHLDKKHNTIEYYRVIQEFGKVIDIDRGFEFIEHFENFSGKKCNWKPVG